MAITALFRFWGYWYPYLQLGGLFGVWHLSFTLFQIFAVVGAALGPTSPILPSFALHPALGLFRHLQEGLHPRVP